MGSVSGFALVGIGASSGFGGADLVARWCVSFTRSVVDDVPNKVKKSFHKKKLKLQI